MNESADRSRIGFFYWVFQFALILVVAGVLHLGVIAQSVLLNLMIFAIFGVMLTLLAVSVRGGTFMPAGFGPRELAATAAGFIVLVLFNLGLAFFFNAPVFASATNPTGGFLDRLMVNVLAAICEEDLMFGVYCAGKAAGLPDIWIVIVSTVVFVPLHALAYQLSLMVSLFLASGRIVFTGLYAVTDHSDPSFIIHVLWNVLNS